MTARLAPPKSLVMLALASAPDLSRRRKAGAFPSSV